MLNLKFPLFVLFAAFSMCACVDRDFDEPPVNDGSVSFPDDQIISIGEVKSYYSQGEFVEIPDAKWMKGVVAGDDESGNIYKSLILQDETDGITVLIDVVEFHNTYFTGREVFVNVEGLFISDFNGLIQIGAGPNDEGDMQRIPEVLASERVQPGKFLGDVDPMVVTFSQLNNSFQSRLIRIEGVEFTSSELGRTYADLSDPASPRSANRSIVNCDGTNFIVRNSGFADFAGEELPGGNGSITGIYGVFGQDQQLTIRDLNDVDMTGERCDGSGGGTGGANMAFDEDGNFIVDASKVVSIADLKSEFYVAGEGNAIAADRVIRGVVTSSDLEGNFFKEITFEDNSGGIKVRIDAFDLFETFPVGTDVALFAQGLFIGDFNGLIQIGGGADGADILRIDEGVFRSHLFPGRNVGEPTPIVVKINELNNSHQNRLIQLDAVQFKTSSAGVTYSEPDFSTNRELEDCDGNSLLLRNSSFADFASDITPDGNGTIKAIYGVFGADQQLFIRDTRDVDFRGMRCDGGGGGTGDRLAVQEVRNLFSGSSTSAPEGFVQGVVISDYENGNITGRNLVIQDGDYGIVLRFSDNHSIPVNSEIQVNIGGYEISEFNGLLQVSTVPNSNVTVLNNSSSVNIREYTVGEVLTNLDEIESTLISIKDANLSGASTFAGTITVDDGTGTISMFTRNDATFASQALPSEATDLVVIVSEFNDPQVNLRSGDDVSAGGGGGGGGEGISEDFESGIDFDPWNGAGWDNIALKGDRIWIKRSFDENGFLEVRGFQEPMPDIEAWVISPSFDLADANTLSFESATAFYTHGGLTVWISAEFTDVNDASWTQLSPTLYNSSTENYEFVPSGDVALPGSGRVRIGFKYEGDNSSNTETARIDNFVVR